MDVGLATTLSAPSAQRAKSPKATRSGTTSHQPQYFLSPRLSRESAAFISQYLLQATSSDPETGPILHCEGHAATSEFVSTLPVPPFPPELLDGPRHIIRHEFGHEAIRSPYSAGAHLVSPRCQHSAFRFGLASPRCLLLCRVCQELGIKWWPDVLRASMP